MGSYIFFVVFLFFNWDKFWQNTVLIANTVSHKFSSKNRTNSYLKDKQVHKALIILSSLFFWGGEGGVGWFRAEAADSWAKEEMQASNNVPFPIRRRKYPWCTKLSLYVRSGKGRIAFSLLCVAFLHFCNSYFHGLICDLLVTRWQLLLLRPMLQFKKIEYICNTT